ncbi:MAG: DUF4843 domain-containing protein [Odoribacteraceae bacterium]|nr:DUF4843 domain-containing protein [Odoribacteraceae bacterium]
MKRIVFMLLCAGIVGFAGCSEQEIEMYDGLEGVYFYHPNNAVSTYVQVDSTSRIEFGRGTVDTLDLSLHVMITGRTKSYPRKVKISVIADSTTAVEGLNYEPLADHYVVEAGANDVNVPLRFFNHENIKTEVRRLDLQLLPTSDFAIGLPVWKSTLSSKPVDATRYTVFLNGAIPQPPRWSGGYSTSTGQELALFGVFSEKKFKLMCEVCNLVYDDFLDTFTMPSVRQTMIYKVMAAYLQAKYNARDPVLEDDGRLMWVATVTWNSKPGVPWDGQY